MVSIFRRASDAWMRATEPMLLNRQGHVVTAKALRAARMPFFPEWYIGMSYLVSASTGVVVAIAAYLALRAFPGLIDAQLLRAGIAVGTGAALFLLTRVAFLAYPRVHAQGRARAIDAELPNVVTLIYALTRGGTSPLEAFRVVANERDAYGELSVEFGVLVRDIEWLGHDMISALSDVSSTTPSPALKALLEGLITIMNSGADPTDYFKRQAQTRFQHDELALEKDTEQASLLAEIYVSGLLVLPLLLLVVLSGLAPIAPGQSVLMPFVVFGMIPLGTVVYLILLSTMMPPEALLAPKAKQEKLMDFGMDAVASGKKILPAPWATPATDFAEKRAPTPEEKALRRSIAMERSRQRFAEFRRDLARRLVAHPMDVLEISGFVGVVVAAAVGYYAWSHGVTGVDIPYALTGILLLGGAIAFIPVSIFHEIRMRRAHRIEKAMPETLSKLAGFNDRGIGLLQSFQLLGKTASGPLAPELQAVERDVSWNGSIANALKRLRARVNTLRMTKLTILLERASAATGNLRDVLDIAAEDATKTEHLREQKHQSMMSYVVVCYIVFAVFLYVLYVVANLFYGPGGLGAAAAGSGSALNTGMDPHAARLLFAEAAVLQGVGCGLVAGRLGEGQMLSGLKHAIFLGIAAFLVFYLGVV